MSNGEEDNIEQVLSDSVDEEKVEDRKIAESRKAFIANWLNRVRTAEKFWDERMFKQIRMNRLFVKGYQWQEAHMLLKDGPVPEDERSVVNVTQRHVKQQTAVLYGKNPKIVCRHKERMLLTAWDGTSAALERAVNTYAAAVQQMQIAASTNNQMAMQLAANQMGDAEAILKEADSYTKYKREARGLAKTLEMVMEHCVDEQPAPFKQKMKDLVRRTLIAKLAYIKVQFNRAKEPVPDKLRELERVQSQLAAIERLTKDASEGDIDLESDAGAEELRLRLEQLKAEVEVLVYEGLVYEYPDPTMLIPDTKVQNLRTFEGASWIAEKIYLTRPQIRDQHGIDVEGNGRSYTMKEAYGGPNGDGGLDSAFDAMQSISRDHATGDKSGEDGTSPGSSLNEGFYCLFEIYDRDTGMTFTICEGVDDYISQPSPPDFAQERFFPYRTLVFNEPDGPGDVVPMSDVELVKSMQMDINAATEGLLEHRVASRPGYMARKGTLSQTTKDNLATRQAHDLVEVEIADMNLPIEKAFSPIPMQAIDPNLYETGTAFTNILRVVGAQEADIGGTSGVTATESAIAQNAKSTATGSDVDALDEFLSDIMRTSGQLLLRNMSKETVLKIVGPSAVWPELTREEVIRDYYLEVEAGSTGRPNQAEEIQNFVQMAPFVFQTPGLSQEFLAKEVIRRLNDKIDLSEAIAAGSPSVQAINAAAMAASRPAGAPSSPSSPSSAGPQSGAANSPQMQGPQGQNNMPSTQPAQVNAAPRPDAGAAQQGGFAQV